MILRLSARYSQTAEVKNRPWPCVLLLMFWCSFSLMGCTEEAFLSTHWSGCKSRIVETQGLTTGHVEKLNKKSLNEFTNFCALKGALWYEFTHTWEGENGKPLTGVFFGEFPLLSMKAPQFLSSAGDWSSLSLLFFLIMDAGGELNLFIQVLERARDLPWLAAAHCLLIAGTLEAFIE